MLLFQRKELRGHDHLAADGRHVGEVQRLLTGTVYPAILDSCVDEVTRIQTRFEDGLDKESVQ